MYENNAVMVSLIFMEAAKDITFFLVCYYFCIKANKYLPHKKTWVKFLRIFMVINVIWITFALIYTEIYQKVNEIATNELCHTDMFIFMRAGSEIVSIIFLIIGIQITRR